MLFLEVIYPLRHPLLALDRIHDICASEALLLLKTHMIDERLVDGGENWRALSDWLQGSSFEPLSTWQHAFRGGAVARKKELAVVGERGLDEAASWDMSTWIV